MSKYIQFKDGDWVRPTMKRYKFMCCDCSLVHDIDFRIVEIHLGGKALVEFRASRNYRSTGQARKGLDGIRFKRKESVKVPRHLRRGQK